MVSVFSRNIRTIGFGNTTGPTTAAVFGFVGTA
jgi:hypothetical protein